MSSLSVSVCKLSMEIGRSWTEFVGLFVPPLSILVPIGVLTFIFAKAARLKFPPGSLLFVSAFCVAGVVPGIVAGYSQQPIAGTFLTATVGIISALLSFAFAKDSLDVWRPVIPVAMIVLLIGALSGFATGGVAKDKWLLFDQDRERAKFAYENLWAPVEKERRLKNLGILQAKNPKEPVSAAELTSVNLVPNTPAPDECEPEAAN